MINTNYILNKLNAGKPIIGTWCNIPSVTTADIISSTGLDFLIIDREHGPIDFTLAQEMSIACNSNGTSPIIRPSGVIENEILKSLDIGAHAIQVPNIENTDQINDLIKFSKYPPIGNRGFSPFTRSSNYSIDNASIIMKEANKNTLIGINVEGQKGIENIESFAEFDEIDMFFIGIYDITKFVGEPGNIKSPEVMKLLKKLTTFLRDKNKAVGTIAIDESSLKIYLDLGINYILYWVDSAVLQNSYKKVVNAFEKIK